MKAIVSMTDDCKKHFRRETQHMLDRMIRKYGCDAIERQVPSSDQIMMKRIRNLRKLHARKERLRAERIKKKLAVEDSDDEDFAVKARAQTLVNESYQVFLTVFNLFMLLKIKTIFCLYKALKKFLLKVMMSWILSRTKAPREGKRKHNLGLRKNQEILLILLIQWLQVK